MYGLSVLCVLDAGVCVLSLAKFHLKAVGENSNPTSVRLTSGNQHNNHSSVITAPSVGLCVLLYLCM